MWFTTYAYSCKILVILIASVKAIAMYQENIVLEQAIQNCLVKAFNGTDLQVKLFNQIHSMKKEFGEGYAFIDFGEYKSNENEFIFPNLEGPRLLWLDEQATYKYLSGETAATVLRFIKSDPCPPSHEILIICVYVDRGDSIKENRYIMKFARFDAKDVLRQKPSSITENQIEKRLKRMHNKVRLLILDTSSPDCMGKNLAKWLRVLKRRSADFNFSVVIDACDEFPAQIPEELEEECWSIRLNA